MAKRRPGPIAATLPALVLCAAACGFEAWLFREGRALVMRADMPAAYHAGLGLPWWASADRSSDPPRAGNAGDTSPRSCAPSPESAAASSSSPPPPAPCSMISARGRRIPSPPCPSPSGAPTSSCPRGPCRGGSPSPPCPPASSSPPSSSARSPRPTPCDPGSPTATTRGSTPSPRAPPSSMGTVPSATAPRGKIPRDVDVRFRREILVRVKAHSPALYRTWAGTPLYLRSSPSPCSKATKSSPHPTADAGFTTRRTATRTPHHPRSRARSREPVRPARLHTYFIDRKSISHLPSPGMPPPLQRIRLRVRRRLVSVLPRRRDPTHPLHRLHRIAPPPSSSARANSAPPAPPRSRDLPAVAPSPLSARVRALCATFSATTRSPPSAPTSPDRPITPCISPPRMTAAPRRVPL